MSKLQSQQKNNTAIYAVLVVGLFVGLIVVSRLAKSTLNPGGGPSPATANCIKPDVPLTMHIHPQLEILVDGERENIPANVGLTQLCENYLHTHDTTGELHIESQVAGDVKYTLKDFFAVWQKPIEREGYNLEVFVSGQATSSTDIVLKDKEKIELKYIKK